ncbi:hypothetical protein ACF073_16765 [Streptomyces sp. NPDC015171]|uniref:hypothetical protein n=1 Tax=Streptomyces sp. NPDC015171 TaxID=3364945 RepID=UPI0036F8739E
MSEPTAEEKHWALTELLVREGFEPVEAMFRAELLLVVFGPSVPWSVRVASAYARRKAIK